MIKNILSHAMSCYVKSNLISQNLQLFKKYSPPPQKKKKQSLAGRTPKIEYTFP